MINYDDFLKVDIRAGEIVEVDDFPEARKPMYKFKIDFGPEIGVKQSAGQITKNYKKEDLLGRTVIGVVNFPPKQIGPVVSEALTLGLVDEEDGVVLLGPDKKVLKGSRMF